MSRDNEERIAEEIDSGAGSKEADDRAFQEAVTGAAGGAPSFMSSGPDAAMHTEPIMQYFQYEHLRPHLQEISRPFGELAQRVLMLPRNPERSVALRKLLEAKDAAVRAALAK